MIFQKSQKDNESTFIFVLSFQKTDAEVEVYSTEIGFP